MNRFAFLGSTVVLTACASASFGAATAFRGTHIGFTTAAGQPGDKIDLRTGYGTSGAPESEQWAFRFLPVAPGVQQLQTRSDRFVNNPTPAFELASYNLWHAAPSNWRPSENAGGTSPVNGWFAQSGMTADPVTQRQTFNPTGGDAFVATGTLTGGDFAYEIVGVQPLGSSPAASFAIGMLVNPSGNTNNALRQLQGTNTVGSNTYDVFGAFDHTLAGGGALSDRSIFLGNGNHFHGWGFFISESGTYDVTMRVYDLSGRYASSDNFTFRINSIPAPGAAGLLSIAGLIAARRRRN